MPDRRPGRSRGPMGARAAWWGLQHVGRDITAADPQPMWAYDASTLQFLEVNDAAIDQYGYSREAFLAVTILDIRPDPDAASVAASVTADPEEDCQAGLRAGFSIRVIPSLTARDPTGGGSSESGLGPGRRRRRP
ncbi:MAG: PAS domain-containing protein, partial [Actinomycetes bacterium]